MASIYKRAGTKYWWAKIAKPDGSELRVSTKIPAEAELKPKARLLAKNMEIELWKGWHPGKKEEANYPFEELMVGFIQEKQPCSGHITNIETLNRFFAGSMVNKLTVNDVLGYKRARKNEGVSDATIRRELSVYSAAINYAVKEWDWELENPIKGRLPANSEDRVRWITPGDAGRLVKAASADMSRYPHLPDFIELSLATGMRKQEVLKLDFGRIDLRQQVIHMNPEDHKNKTYATIPLNRSARKVILRRMTWIKENCPGSKLMFPNLKQDPDGNTPLGDIKSGFKGACSRAGITDFRPHDLRHTFASWLVQSGVSLYVVKDLLRHKSITQTEKYAHLAPRNKAESVDLLDQLLPGLQYGLQSENLANRPLEIIDNIAEISIT